MENPGIATTDPAPHTFSQVLFVDIPQSYPPATPITCRYTLTPALQPQPRDWVGIFKVKWARFTARGSVLLTPPESSSCLFVFLLQVGWNTTKDYHTFVWIDVGGEQSTMTRQVIFNGEKGFRLSRKGRVLLLFGQACLTQILLEGFECFGNMMHQQIRSLRLLLVDTGHTEGRLSEISVNQQGFGADIR